ncbi:hypothetical protein PIB30_030361 [Stylosanthes scabra]|uniref:Uncharacterized protein n=1 Tax=Stylosanthes scabra TaxID=79078 RepID=A0ABU6VEM3_9FABA|nr:hypothetical protein [Stylosanthes scabra]
MVVITSLVKHTSPCLTVTIVRRLFCTEFSFHAPPHEYFHAPPRKDPKSPYPLNASGRDGSHCLLWMKCSSSSPPSFLVLLFLIFGYLLVLILNDLFYLFRCFVS